MKGRAILRNPIFWGGIATILLTSIVYWLSSKEFCTTGFMIKPSCQTKLAYFLESSPNEVGDALAGFAGTLAFVWIIVTVWLQSQELREQRKVLIDQKSEIAFQRQATEKMAMSLEQQVKLSELQRESHTQDRNARIVERMLDGLQQSIESEVQLRHGHWRLNEPFQYLSQATGTLFQTNGKRDFHIFEVNYQAISSRSDFASSRLRRFHIIADTQVNTLKSIMEANTLASRSSYRSHFVAIVQLIRDIQSRLGGLPEDYKIYLRNLELQELATTLEDLLSLDVWTDEAR